MCQSQDSFTEEVRPTPPHSYTCIQHSHVRSQASKDVLTDGGDSQGLVMLYILFVLSY